MAIGYNTQRSLLRNIVVGLGIQQDAHQAFEDADLTEHVKIDPSNFVKWTPEHESDIGQAGKGHSSATENDMIALSMALDVTMKANEWNMGWLLALVMGDVATVGAGPTYTHTFTFDDTQNSIAKVTNIYCEDDAGLQYRALDVAGSKFTITGNNKGVLQVSASLMGTGHKEDGAMAAIPAIVARQKFFGSDTKILLGPVGAPVDYSIRILDWEVTADRGTTAERRPGNGLEAAFMEWGDPKPSLKLVIASDGSSDVRNWQRAGTALECRINTTSGNRQLNFIFPTLKLAADDLSSENGKVAYTVTMDENYLLRVPGKEVMTAVLVNSVPAYQTTVVPEE